MEYLGIDNMHSCLGFIHIYGEAASLGHRVIAIMYQHTCVTLVCLATDPSVTFMFGYLRKLTG